MKKQFFYAAFAIAMMASCTSEDNFPVDPANPTPEEEKVALQLGIDAPSVNAEVGSRGTGSVGDVAGDNNKWNNQQLFITMIDRATGNVALDDQSNKILAWDSYEYIAPRAVDQTDDDVKGNIRIYQKNTYNKTEGQSDKGTIQYLYYPVSGKYDFYGWHLDGALTQTTTNPDIQATAATDADKTNGYPTITLSDITIDGTQDIMAAKTTDPTTASNWDNELTKWLYSARTARNEVHPVLKFEHKLARLKFFVRAGSDETALKNTANNWASEPAKKIAGDHTSTGAMYVTGIRALKMINKFNMTLGKDGTKATAGESPTANATFALGDKLKAEYDDSDKKVGEIDTLVAVAPEWFWKYNGKPVDYKGTPVGESIMFLPEGAAKNSISFQMDLKQYVQLTDDETTTNDDKWGYKSQLNAPFTINANNVKKTDAQGNTVAVSEFKAGESYNVYITIYGFERIEVSAELTAWEMGGDVDVDIEEGESSTPGDDATETVTATFKIANLAQGVEATVTLNNGENKKVTAPAEGAASVEFTVNKGVAYTYTVTAAGYDNATGELTTTETADNFEEAVVMALATPAPATGKTVTFGIPEGATLSWSYGDNVTGATTTIENVPAETVITYSVTKEYFETVEDAYIVVAEGENTVNVTMYYATVEKTFIITDCSELATITVNAGSPVNYAANDGEGTKIEITPTGETISIVIATDTKLETITMSLADLHNEEAFTIAYSELDNKA